MSNRKNNHLINRLPNNSCSPSFFRHLSRHATWDYGILRYLVVLSVSSDLDKSTTFEYYFYFKVLVNSIVDLRGVTPNPNMWSAYGAFYLRKYLQTISTGRWRNSFTLTLTQSRQRHHELDIHQVCLMYLAEYPVVFKLFT